MIDDSANVAPEDELKRLTRAPHELVDIKDCPSLLSVLTQALNLTQLRIEQLSAVAREALARELSTIITQLAEEAHKQILNGVFEDNTTRADCHAAAVTGELLGLTNELQFQARLKQINRSDAYNYSLNQREHKHRRGKRQLRAAFWLKEPASNAKAIARKEKEENYPYKELISYLRRYLSREDVVSTLRGRIETLPLEYIHEGPREIPEPLNTSDASVPVGGGDRFLLSWLGKLRRHWLPLVVTLLPLAIALESTILPTPAVGLLTQIDGILRGYFGLFIGILSAIGCFVVSVIALPRLRIHKVGRIAGIALLTLTIPSFASWHLLAYYQDTQEARQLLNRALRSWGTVYVSDFTNSEFCGPSKPPQGTEISCRGSDGILQIRILETDYNALHIFKVPGLYYGFSASFYMEVFISLQKSVPIDACKVFVKWSYVSDDKRSPESNTVFFHVRPASNPQVRYIAETERLYNRAPPIPTLAAAQAPYVGLRAIPGRMYGKWVKLAIYGTEDSVTFLANNRSAIKMIGLRPRNPDTLLRVDSVGISNVVNASTPGGLATCQFRRLRMFAGSPWHQPK